MKITTESYDALGALLPKTAMMVQSSFHAQLGQDDGMPEPIVLGILITKEGAKDHQVEPRYLTQQQLDSAAT